MKPTIRKAIIASVLLPVFSSPVLAKPQSTPAGPWITPSQTMSLEAFSNYQQLTDNLMSIEHASRGRVEIDIAGTTAAGRSVWLAKIGDSGKPPVLIITQQHGDEPHGTEAALDLIKFLGGGSREARRITDNLYVLIMPRVNPDGSEMPTRGNADFDNADPRSTKGCAAAGYDDKGKREIYTTKVPGSSPSLYSYDINRYHWADWKLSYQYQCDLDENGAPKDTVNPVAEAQAVLDTFARYQPVWLADMHNQGNHFVDPDQCAADQACRPGQYVTGGLMWPTNSDVSSGAVDLSKQMAVIVKQRSMELGNVELTRYDGDDTFPAIARNAYGLLGAGSLLFEVAGQTEGSSSFVNGQKANGKITNGVRKMLLSLLEATANGSLFTVNPADAENLLIDNGINASNPRYAEE